MIEKDCLFKNLYSGLVVLGDSETYRLRQDFRRFGQHFLPRLYMERVVGGESAQTTLDQLLWSRSVVVSGHTLVRVDQAFLAPPVSQSRNR